MYGLRVVIADTDVNFRKKIKEQLARVGYNVMAEVEEGQRALQTIFNTQPDVVFIDYGLPKRGGLEVAKIVEEQGIAPTILLSNYSDQSTVLEASNLVLITGYLVKPLDETAVVPAIQLAVSNFKKNALLLEENRKLKKEIENRKYIDKAKSILMKTKKLDEDQAYRLLQKISMDNSVSLITIAKRIIKGMYLN